MNEFKVGECVEFDMLEGGHQLPVRRIVVKGRVTTVFHDCVGVEYVVPHSERGERMYRIFMFSDVRKSLTTDMGPSFPGDSGRWEMI